MPRRPFKPPPLPERMVDTDSALADCVEHLSAHRVIGFDTEFVGEDTFRPELCLIQVSTAERLYLIDPYALDSLASFWALLHDSARTVIAHAGREEVRMCRFQSGAPPANLFDTQIAAGLIGLTYPISYAGLVQIVLGTRLNKGDTLSDWRRRPLSASQVRYAYDDVRYLIPAYERLSAKLEAYTRTDWATEEFTGFVKWTAGEDAAVERWRKVKGGGALNRRELAVLRAVFAWRLGVAERQDRPARSVMRDDVLLEVARRGAKAPDELGSLRGIPPKEFENVQRAVREANRIPPAELPHKLEAEQDPPQVAVLGSLLTVVLNDVCDRLKLAQSLVCSQQDLKDLVRSRQPGGMMPDDSPFRNGWRKEAVLPHLERVLEGGLAVRVNDPKTRAPLEYIELVSEDE
jgi:ribonuclease D